MNIKSRLIQGILLSMLPFAGSPLFALTLKQERSYKVPANEVWRLANPKVFDGPSSDIDFSKARVYFSRPGSSADSEFLMSGDFSFSINDKLSLDLFIQPGSEVKIGQRPDIDVIVIKGSPASPFVPQNER